MFLRYVLVLFLGGFSSVYGQNKLLDHDFWQTATVDSVRAELKAGARVNAKDMDGKTPLMYAADHNRNPAVIKLLLASGADINARCQFGWSVLLHAVLRDPLGVIKLLIENGATIDARDKYNKTPLMYAVEHNKSLDIIKLLLASGADINAQDEDGATPLMWVSVLNKKKVTKVLLAAGANAKLKDNYGKTALDFIKENYPLKDNKSIQKMLRKAMRD